MLLLLFNLQKYKSRKSKAQMQDQLSNKYNLGTPQFLEINKAPQNDGLPSQEVQSSKGHISRGRCTEGGTNQQDWKQLSKFVNSKTTKLQEFFEDQQSSDLQQINFAWLKLGAELTFYLSQVTLPNIKKISLVQNNLGPSGAQHLSRCSWPNIEYIDLRNNNLKNQGLKFLSSAQWPKIQHILFNYNQITSIGLCFLRGCQWSNIKQLNLSSNKIGTRGISSLSKMNLVQMDTLDMGNCGLGLDATKKLVRTDWPELILLNITMNNIGDEGIRILTKSNWPKLQYIELQFNNVRSGLRLLQGRWPQMKFPYLYGNRACVQMIENTVKKLIINGLVKQKP